jgi:chromosome segregation ATPase
MEKLKHSENKFKSRQIEINQTREKFDAEIKEQTKNVAHWKRELKKLKLREVPGEEVDEELEMHSTEALEALDMKQWQYDLNLMEERLGALKVNYAIIEEYKKKEALYLGKSRRLHQHCVDFYVPLIFRARLRAGRYI